MKRFAPLALIAALTLTGCAPKALEVAPGPSVMPAVQEISGEDARQAWADEQITDWLSANGARSIDALFYPYSHVDSWESLENGELIVHTKDGAYDEVALGMIASDILHGTSKNMRKVTVVNEFGKLDASYERMD